MPPNAYQAAQAQLQNSMGILGSSPDPMAEFGAVASTLNPDEQLEFQDKFPALLATKNDAARGIDAREQLYNELKNSNSKLSKDRADLIKKMAEDQPLSKAETAAMLFVGLLPTLIGKAVGGNKGGAAGAQAGSVGTQVMAQGFEKDTQRKRLQAQGELEDVNNQLKDNRDLQNKAVLDEINAADTSREKELDRATTKEAAAIRAGGDKSLANAISLQAKQTSADIKELTKSRLSVDEQARTRSKQIGASVIEPGGTFTEDGRKKLEDKGENYAKIADYTEKLIALIDNQGSESWSSIDPNVVKDYQAIRESLVKAVAAEEKVSGMGGSNSFLEEIKKELPDPASFLQSIKRGVSPFTPTAKEKLLSQLEVKKMDLGYLAEGLGAKAMRIGQMQLHKQTKQPLYLMGVNPETGKPLWTDDVNEVNAILQNMKLRLVKPNG